MKKTCFVAALFCLSADLLGQKQSDSLSYKKESPDSLLGLFPKLNQPFVAPAPKELNDLFNNPAEKNNNFETTHPGARIINKTSRGTIYSMLPDNMAVLVPDMNQVEKMPNGRRLFNAPGDRMPNPLKPKNRK
jgi:hypothetical protein